MEIDPITREAGRDPFEDDCLTARIHRAIEDQMPESRTGRFGEFHRGGRSLCGRGSFTTSADLAPRCRASWVRWPLLRFRGACRPTRRADCVGTRRGGNPPSWIGDRTVVSGSVDQEIGGAVSPQRRCAGGDLFGPVQGPISRLDPGVHGVGHPGRRPVRQEHGVTPITTGWRSALAGRAGRMGAGSRGAARAGVGGRSARQSAGSTARQRT